MKNYKNNVGADAPKSAQKGITLIALVITIIVMLILVAVTISMAINGGLFQKAGEAVGDTQNKINEEQTLANGKIKIDGKWYASIDDYLAGKEEVVPNPNETFSTIYEENTTITQGSYTAVIPKGFAVGISEGINTIEQGLVITDEVNSEGKSTGNEFVWIPVEVKATDNETSIASFYRSDWSNNARSTDYTNSTKYVEEKTTIYNEMVKSVYNNAGFYIGRYEAGVTVPRLLYEDDGATLKPTSATVPVEVKRDLYPYTVIWFSGSSSSTVSTAIDLCVAMYEGKDVGVYSYTCFGVQWDAMLDFVKDDNYNVTNSTDWGNYADSEYSINRPTAQYFNVSEYKWFSIPDTGLIKSSSLKIVLTTGASEEFAAKNIYDLAGNVNEGTNEILYATPSGAPSYVTMPALTTRGGGWGSSNCAASYRSTFYVPATSFSDSIGFRPTLYIK